MKTTDSFGKWLKARRKALDLTQSELAGQVGCSVVTLQKIEAEERRPSKQITERLADVLAIALDDRASFVAFARRSETSPPHIPGRVAPPSARHNLPPQLTSFVGREAELAKIAEYLRDATCRLVTLVGPGGIGKTRLALQAASEQSQQYAHGVWFVPLASLNTPDLLPAALAGALQFSFYGSDDPMTQLAHYLSDKEMLLVLDNAEHLLEGVGLLSDILTQARQAKLLVTSRERLNLQEEWAISIQGLPFPIEGAGEDTIGYSAVQLFTQRARQVQASFTLSGNADAVVAICRAVEGMPLALELAAGWLRIMPCHQIADEIQRSLDFLASPHRNLPERHRSIRAVFDRSWSLLTDAERNALSKLSVFRGGFEREAAAQVAEASLQVLTALVDKSMIQPVPSGHYSLHELLRQYAYDKLMERGEAEATAHRHLVYFVELAERAETMLYTLHQVTWQNRLEAGQDNLRAALGWALSDGDTVMGLRLASALAWFWDMRLYHGEGRDWLVRLLAAAGKAPPRLWAKALHRAGDLSGFFEDWQQATGFDEEALALAREADDKWNIAWSLSNLGVVKTNVDYGQARAALEEAIGLFRELGDGWGLNHALARLGGAAEVAGDRATMTTALEECLSLARAAGVKSAIAWALFILAGSILPHGCELDRAVALIEESLPLFRDARDKTGLWTSLDALSRIAYLQGDYGRAWKLQDECVTLIRAMGWIAALTSSLGLQARIARSQGNYEYARSHLANCLAMSRDSGLMVGVAVPLALVAGISLDQQRPAPAAKLLGAAQIYAEASTLSPNVINRAALAELEQDIAGARAQLDEATFAAAWAEGQAMSLEQAIAFARDELD